MKAQKVKQSPFDRFREATKKILTVKKADLPKAPQKPPKAQS